MFAQKGVIMKNHKNLKIITKYYFIIITSPDIGRRCKKTEKQQNYENLSHIF
jgi:hypothetical protein